MISHAASVRSGRWRCLQAGRDSRVKYGRSKKRLMRLANEMLSAYGVAVEQIYHHDYALELPLYRIKLQTILTCWVWRPGSQSCQRAAKKKRHFLVQIQAGMNIAPLVVMIRVLGSVNPYF